MAAQIHLIHIAQLLIIALVDSTLSKVTLQGFDSCVGVENSLATSDYSHMIQIEALNRNG